MSIQGVALMFYQPIFFPPLTRKLGVVNSFRFGAVMFTTCIFTLPLIGRLAAYPTLLWPVFALQRVLDMVSGASCGGAGQLLIINAANEGEQGRLQGLAGVCRVRSLWRSKPRQGGLGAPALCIPEWEAHEKS